VSDRWKWNIHTSQCYTISSTYHYLTTLENVTTYESSCIICHKAGPLKISLFDWNLLRNRIPITDNLLWWGLLQNHQQLCVCRFWFNEDINHLFLLCNFFGSIYGLWFCNGWVMLRCFLLFYRIIYNNFVI